MPPHSACTIACWGSHWCLTGPSARCWETPLAHGPPGLESLPAWLCGRAAASRLLCAPFQSSCDIWDVLSLAPAQQFSGLFTEETVFRAVVPSP